MKTRRIQATSIILSAALAMDGCAGTGMTGDQTALDKSINECIGSVLLGTALGALIGSASHGNAGRGALYGAGAGTVACAVMVAINNAQDRQRIRQNQLAALQTGENHTDTYVGQDGTARTVQTNVQTVSAPANFASSPTASTADPIVGPCRKITTQISVAGKGDSEVDPGFTCQTRAGNWVNWNGQTSV